MAATDEHDEEKTHPRWTNGRMGGGECVMDVMRDKEGGRRSNDRGSEREEDKNREMKGEGKGLG